MFTCPHIINRCIRRKILKTIRRLGRLSVCLPKDTITRSNEKTCCMCSLKSILSLAEVYNEDQITIN